MVEDRRDFGLSTLQQQADLLVDKAREQKNPHVLQGEEAERDRPWTRPRGR